MYGWRGRIGLILPSCNTVMESELPRATPEGVSLHASRVPIKKVTEHELVTMAREAIQAARLLLDAKVDVIVFGCTSGSFVGGIAYNVELENEIRSVTGIPSVTTSSAVVAALKAQKVRKVAVVTPYSKTINRKEHSFLTENGFLVLDIEGLGIDDGYEIGKVEPHVVYELAMNVAKRCPEVDGLFISCTNLRSLEVVPLLCHELHKPVISSNQATLWYALKLLGMSYPINAWGCKGGDGK